MTKSIMNLETFSLNFFAAQFVCVQLLKRQELKKFSEFVEFPFRRNSKFNNLAKRDCTASFRGSLVKGNPSNSQIDSVTRKNCSTFEFTAFPRVNSIFTFPLTYTIEKHLPLRKYNSRN